MSGVSTFTDDMAGAILDRIAAGESLRRICADESMPNPATVFRWLAENKPFCEQYARAREEQADTYADEVVSIADEADDPNNKRVRIDARKWAASKLKPKRYGDKIVQEHTGPNGGAVQSKVTIEFVGAAPGGVPLPVARPG